RTASRSARIDRPSAAEARETACTRSGPRPPPAPPASSATRMRTHSRQRRRVFLQQLGERRPARARPHLNQNVENARGQRLAIAAKNLSNSATETIADDGPSHSPGNRDPEPGFARRCSPEQEKLKQAARNPDAGCVALLEIPSFSKAVVAGEQLPADRTWIHTVSRLRPLRRRAEMTARPERVRIRTRKP